jgi:hypothetical protein
MCSKKLSFPSSLFSSVEGWAMKMFFWKALLNCQVSRSTGLLVHQYPMLSTHPYPLTPSSSLPLYSNYATTRQLLRLKLRLLLRSGGQMDHLLLAAASNSLCRFNISSASNARAAVSVLLSTFSRVDASSRDSALLVAPRSRSQLTR